MILPDIKTGYFDLEQIAEVKDRAGRYWHGFEVSDDLDILDPEVQLCVGLTSIMLTLLKSRDENRGNHLVFKRMVPNRSVEFYEVRFMANLRLDSQVGFIEDIYSRLSKINDGSDFNELDSVPFILDKVATEL